ncbi:MAG: M56 family peptidase, partial [Mycobacterium sp.]|nr:M56 family peptidase [Mycobacterium sp.]
MSALAFTLVALLLSGPVPAMLARASWPLRAPRAAIVLWQSVALAAVLSAFSAGIAIASRLFAPGADGRPTATITSEIAVLGWPLWTAYVLVFALTLMIGARLIASVINVAIATRRRRAHHRMVVDLVGASRATAPQRCAHHPRPLAGAGLRILDVAQPLAYCLPGVRSRVVVSEGALNTLADNEITAIL